MNDLEIVRLLLGTEVKVQTPMRTFRRTLREDQEGFYTLDRNEKCYVEYKVIRYENYKPFVNFEAMYWIPKNKNMEEQ